MSSEQVQLPAIIRGDTKRLKFVVVDSDDVAYNLTGYNFCFTVCDKNNAIVIQKFLATIPSPELGIATVVLENTDTKNLVGTYYWDAQFVRVADSYVLTPFYGDVQFSRDQSRRVL